MPGSSLPAFSKMLPGLGTNARKRFANCTDLADPEPIGREETKLWRMVLFFLVLLATAVAALSWERLQFLPYSLLAIPVGLLALAFLFASYAYGRHKEV